MGITKMMMMMMEKMALKDQISIKSIKLKILIENIIKIKIKKENIIKRIKIEKKMIKEKKYYCLIIGKYLI